MSTETLDIAKKYFELSNARNLNEVESLFTDVTVYISANTGTFTGRQEIMEMMKSFFANFQQLHWDIQSVEEDDTDTVTFDFKLTAVKNDGENIEKEGLESITVVDGKIARIEIRNK